MQNKKKFTYLIFFFTYFFLVNNKIYLANNNKYLNKVLIIKYLKFKIIKDYNFFYFV